MKIGVISDTHGFFDPKIPRLFADVDHILHAGDVGTAFVTFQLEQIDYLVLSEGELAQALPLLESMPRLRRLSVYEALTTAEERALAASKLTRRLETLELCYDERDLVKGS